MRHLRILLIEDELADAELIRAMLRRLTDASFELLHATTMQDASRHLVAEVIDVALLDLSLPDASGLEGLTRLQASHPRVPVLVLTGNADEQLAVKAVTAHAQDYLVKWTFTEVLLARAIRYAMERHRILLELEQARTAAEAASCAKSELLANVSHELRTPLTAIEGMTDLLASTSLSERQTELVRRLGRASKHLISLVDDLLDMGAIEQGRLRLDSHAINLRELIDDTMAMLNARARDKRLGLRLRLAPDLPATILGDGRRLRQVLINLVGNAIKFTESGTVEVTVEPGAAHDAPGELRFTVADTGIGIPPELHRIILDRFTQADGSIARRHGGAGLGLAIAKSLVELMGGTLGLQSTPGRGSVFSFNVAFQLAPPTEAPPRSPPPDGSPRRSTPLRVLLADDADDTRLLVQSYLEDAGHELCVVTSGEAALEESLATRYDVVLMDVHMPQLDGLAATRRLRTEEGARSIDPTPVLALTADALPECLQRCLAEGCSGYLAKPFSKQQLLEAVESCACRPSDPAQGPPPAKAARSAANAACRCRADGQSPAAGAPPSGPSVRGGAGGIDDGVAAAAPAVVVHVDQELRALMPKFLRNRRDDVERMRLALAREDFETVWTLGHNMRGSAASYGLAAVGALGGAVADAARRRDAATVERLAGELERYLGRVELSRGGDP